MADANTVQGVTFDNTGPTTNTVGGVEYNNAAPAANTVSGVAFNNSAAVVYDDEAEAPDPVDPTAGNTVAGVSYSNTPPTGNVVAGGTFDNTAPGTNIVGGIEFENGDPDGIDMTVLEYDNTPPDAMVLAGEQSPTAPIVPPDQPVAVSHGTELTAAQNYRVMVGSRAAPVTVTLPDPGGLNQWIEIVDASMQAATYPITVNPGTKTIDGASGARTLNLSGQVLEIIYTSTGWKIL
jgi:hypothetical protein